MDIGWARAATSGPRPAARDVDTRGRGHGGELCQSAVPIETDSGIRGAEVRPPPATPGAGPAGDAGAGSHERSCLQTERFIAGILDEPSELVAGDHRAEVAGHRVTFLEREHDRAVGELCAIRAADADGGDAQEHLARSRLRPRDLLDADVSTAVHHGSAHPHDSVLAFIGSGIQSPPTRAPGIAGSSAPRANK